MRRRTLGRGARAHSQPGLSGVAGGGGHTSRAGAAAAAEGGQSDVLRLCAAGWESRNAQLYCGGGGEQLRRLYGRAGGGELPARETSRERQRSDRLSAR